MHVISRNFVTGVANSLVIAVVSVVVACADEQLCSQDFLPLDESAVIFAAVENAGMMYSEVDEFFRLRHGIFEVYVFGDGRFVFMDESSVRTDGYRVWRKGRVPDDVFERMFCDVASLSVDDGGSYLLCGQMLDGGGQNISINLPRLNLIASASPDFGAGTECSHDNTLTENPEANLVSLANSLFSLSTKDTEVIVTDRIVVAGHRASSSPNASCKVETAVAWPYDEIELSKNQTAWSVEIDSPLSDGVRNFIRQHLKDWTEEYWMACVTDGIGSWFVYYDDVPPVNAQFPPNVN